MGVTDELVALGRKSPDAKALLDAVDDRTEAALHQFGMDLDKLNLRRDQEVEAIKLIEAVNGLADEETAALARSLTGNAELTQAGGNGTLKSDFRLLAPANDIKQEVCEGVVQRVTAKGYNEAQVRDAIGELETYEFNMENVADHVVERIVDRQVSAAGMDDAIKNPLKTTPVKYDSFGRPSYKVIGKTVSVSINPETGRLITVHPTHKKLFEKLIKEANQ